MLFRSDRITDQYILRSIATSYDMELCNRIKAASKLNDKILAKRLKKERDTMINIQRAQRLNDEMEARERAFNETGYNE